MYVFFLGCRCFVYFVVVIISLRPKICISANAPRKKYVYTTMKTMKQKQKI